MSGNDTVYGSSYNDLIQGGYGDDQLFGNAGNDTLIGQQGNDWLSGGAGDDFLHGGSTDNGNDYLDGGAGLDRLYGGPGDDTYVHGTNSGVDIINDGMSEALIAGYGGGNDTIKFTGISSDQLAAYRPPASNDLWLSSRDDFSDGYLNDGVIIEDFFLNDANTNIEWVITSDQFSIYLGQLL